MATLAALRAKLNGELGVDTDAETSPWSPTVRDNAIIDGYAALWRAGVWKALKQDHATVADQHVYTLSAIRRLDRLELLDSDLRVGERPRGVVEDDGAGAWQLYIPDTLAEGYTLRVRGWGPYKSQFSGDGDTDDLPAEHNRVPLLKAKAICYRKAVGDFARYGEAQSLPPSMNVSMEGFIALLAASEREFTEEARALARLRPRSSQVRRL